MGATRVSQMGSGPFAGLIGQAQVRRFLTVAVSSGALSQAYLFVGPPGSGKTDAAYALAAAVLCDKNGCGRCDSCVRVSRRTHPDVRFYEPDGTSTYTVSQIRDIVHDTTLAPIRGSRKIYILNRVDQLGTAAANAFLKTLEEPPDDVLFILMGRQREQVLPTIVSRCQVVPFRRIPSEEGAEMLVQLTGCGRDQARQALAACGGSVAKARTFMLTPSRREVRHRVLDVLDGLAEADDLTVLENARELLTLVKAPLDQVRAQQQQAEEESKDYLGKSALKELEKKHQRELTQREREGLGELTNIVRSWLRDLLVISSGADWSLVVNGDHDAGLRHQASHVAPGAVARAVSAVDQASARISYNVSSQLAIEAMLFKIQEVLSWPR